MSMNQIPKAAGTFNVRREKQIIRGRSVRTCTLVFTTPDGFVGESVPRHGRFDHRAAYEAALAARASAQWRASIAEKNRVPRPGETCNKPAPVAQLLHAIHESTLFGEVERRGYEIVIPGL